MDDAHGVIQIHSCPSALAQHVEWTLSHVVGRVTRLEWRDQPVLDGSLRAELEWEGPAGSAARLATALRGWQDTRFEVTESTATNRDGVRFVHTPSLGIFYTLTDSIGNAMVGEDRIRYAMEIAGGDVSELERELSIALGTAWDDELETFRRAQFVPSLVGDASRAV
jgi:hypothetical protein